MSLHKYAYAGMNPILHADPGGQEFSVAGNLASISIGSGISSLKNEHDALWFEAVSSAVQGVQAGLTGGQIYTLFLSQQFFGLGLGLGIAGGIKASSWLAQHVNIASSYDFFAKVRGRIFSNNKQIGDAGEEIARDLIKKLGFADVFALQNRSNNGIDVIARTPDGRLAFFEVKTTNIGRIPTLSERQSDAGRFVSGILRDAAEGQGRYKQLDRRTKEQAAELLREFNDAVSRGEGVFCAVVGIDLQGAYIGMLPWL